MLSSRRQLGMLDPRSHPSPKCSESPGSPPFNQLRPRDLPCLARLRVRDKVLHAGSRPGESRGCNRRHLVCGRNALCQGERRELRRILRPERIARPVTDRSSFWTEGVDHVGPRIGFSSVNVGFLASLGLQLVTRNRQGPVHGLRHAPS